MEFFILGLAKVMSTSAEVVSMTKWDSHHQKISVMLLICSSSLLLDVASFNKTQICVSCLSPSTRMVTGMSSFSSATTQLNTVFNKTLSVLSTTVLLPNSTRIPWVTSLALNQQNDSFVTINVRPESSAIKVDILDTAGTSISTTSLDTRIKFSSLAFQYRSNSHQDVSASLAPSTVRYQGSTVNTKAEKPCSGNCPPKEDKPKSSPPNKDEEFKLTLPIKYGFFAAGMAIPMIVTFAIAAYGTYRYQRQNERNKQKARPVINIQRVASVKPGRVRANNNSLSPMLTVPRREWIPLNKIRSEASINYACSDENVDQIASEKL